MEPREVALIGRLIAGTTHEVKNVLAIIKESSGLLQDILRLKKAMPCQGGADREGDHQDPGTGRARQRPARGSQLAGAQHERPQLLRGSERALHRIFNLVQRFARLKQVEFEVQPTDADATVEADVVRLLFVLVTCIEYYLNRESPKGRVVLRPGGSSGEAIVKISAGSAAGHQVRRIRKGGWPAAP